MENWPILTLVTFLPLAGVAFIMVLRGEAAAVDLTARGMPDVFGGPAVTCLRAFFSARKAAGAAEAPGIPCAL